MNPFQSFCHMKASLMTLAACLLFVCQGYTQVWNPYPEQAKSINAPNPIFPDAAKNNIYGDYIRVAMSVDKTGRVTAARALGLLAPCSNLNDPAVKAIGKAAEAAANQAVFEPTMKKGKPVEALLYLDYRLRPVQKPLSDEERKTVISGVLNGIALSLPQPEFPAQAKAKGLKGGVSVKVLVGEDGHAISAGAFSGHPYFADAVVAAGCQARFSPMTLRREPAKRSGIITYNFIR